MPDQTHDAAAPLGDIDGEAIDAVTIRLSGTARFPRRLNDGERVILVIEGTTKSDLAIKRKDGQLIRGQTIAIETIGEPTDQLADETAIFLRLIADANAARLPFDEDDEARDPACTCDYDDLGSTTIDSDCPIHGAAADDWEYPDPEETETGD